MGNDSNLWGQKIWDWVNYLAFWNDRGSKDSNESTMESTNDEPVDPPEDALYFLYIHESFIGSDGNRVRSTYQNVEGNYGGFLKDESNYKTLNEIKKDSIEAMKYRFNPDIPSRRRDSITISKKCC